MHVAQIAVAVTRDLITKYHYFHTSFQIWPDQIKVRARGRKNCTLRRVVHPGVAAKGIGTGEMSSGPLKKRRFLGSGDSAKWRLWEGPRGWRGPAQKTDQWQKQHNPAVHQFHSSVA